MSSKNIGATMPHAGQGPLSPPLRPPVRKPPHDVCRADRTGAHAAGPGKAGSCPLCQGVIGGHMAGSTRRRVPVAVQRLGRPALWRSGRTGGRARPLGLWGIHKPCHRAGVLVRAGRSSGAGRAVPCGLTCGDTGCRPGGLASWLALHRALRPGGEAGLRTSDCRDCLAAWGRFGQACGKGRKRGKTRA